MRSVAILAASIVMLAGGGAAMAGSGLTGAPGPGITGNDTGGIIPYSPDIEPIYRHLAADYCAGWGRLSHITSVHRQYGDYIAFVCIDKPWMVH
jgi:hypothetical protein